MKINWHPNPFFTKVELDEQDKKHLLNAYKVDQYEEILCCLEMDMSGEFNRFALTDIDKIREQVAKWGPICNLDVDSQKMSRLLTYLDDIHMGDCICVPCSCTRCYAEDLLGINTIPVGKHLAYKIDAAFFSKQRTRTIDEAIHILSKPYRYEDRSEGYKDYCEEHYMRLAERWNREREEARAWLISYKEEHGF